MRFLSIIIYHAECLYLHKGLLQMHVTFGQKRYVYHNSSPLVWKAHLISHFTFVEFFDDKLFSVSLIAFLYATEHRI